MSVLAKLSRSNRKSLTIRHFYMDIVFILYEYKTEMSLIHEAYDRGDFAVIKKDSKIDYESILAYQYSVAYVLLEVPQLVKKLVERTIPVLHEYGVRLVASDQFEDAFESRSFQTMDEHATLIYFMSSIATNDHIMIEHHLLQGDYLTIMQKLIDIIRTPNNLNKLMFSNLYQRSLNQMLNHCNDKEELVPQIKLMKKLVKKERLRDPIGVQGRDYYYMCPTCKEVLIIENQLYCHYCGQRLIRNTVHYQ